MNDKEYEETLALIDGLMDAKPNTPEEAELERLSLLVEEYEDEHYPIEEPDRMIRYKAGEFYWLKTDEGWRIGYATKDDLFPGGRYLFVVYDWNDSLNGEILGERDFTGAIHIPKPIPASADNTLHRQRCKACGVSRLHWLEEDRCGCRYEVLETGS